MQALDQLLSSEESQLKNLAHRLKAALADGSIRIQTPPFLTTGRMYRQLPDHLKALLHDADLALLKGEVNYRRLVGDPPLGRCHTHRQSSRVFPFDLFEPSHD